MARTDAQDKALRLAYFLLGAALPLISWSLWSRSQDKARLEETDHTLEVTGEESFPASDPPASW